MGEMCNIVPNQVKLSCVIFDIWALWCSVLSVSDQVS